MQIIHKDYSTLLHTFIFIMKKAGNSPRHPNTM